MQCPYQAKRDYDGNVKVTLRYSENEEVVALAYIRDSEITVECKDKKMHGPDVVSFDLGASKSYHVSRLSYSRYEYKGSLAGFKQEDVSSHCDIWYHSDSIRISKTLNGHPNSVVGPAVIHLKRRELEYKLAGLEDYVTEEQFKQQYLITHLEEYVPATKEQITRCAAEFLHPSNYDPMGIFHYTLDAAIEILQPHTNL